MKEPIFSYGQWRQRLLGICINIAVIVFFTELFILFLDEWAGLLFLPLPLYVFRFLILPSSINFLSIFVCYKLMQSPKLQERTKNFVASVMLFLLCACVELVHYVFAPIFCAPCIAIFFSGIYADKKITRILFEMSLVSLSLAALLAAIELRRGDQQLLLDWIVAVVVTICTFLVTRFQADFEENRTQNMVSSYKKQFELAEQLKHDYLTGLYNRRTLFDLLDYHIDKQPPGTLHLAVIDIDDFKMVNDTYGHLKGDAVLIYLAELLEKFVLQYGFIARFGGEEFALVFTNIPVTQAYDIIEMVRKEFSLHRFDFKEDGAITFACGLTTYQGQKPQEFFEFADKALYQAKGQGKNCTVCFGDTAAEPTYTCSTGK